MYIGKLGDGSSPDDGIYILLKEVWITVLMSLLWKWKIHRSFIRDKKVTIRDFGGDSTRKAS